MRIAARVTDGAVYNGRRHQKSASRHYRGRRGMSQRKYFHRLLAPDTCKFNFVSWGAERWQQAVHLLLSCRAVNGPGAVATSEQFMPA